MANRRIKVLTPTGYELLGVTPEGQVLYPVGQPAPAGGGVQSYTHTQAMPASTWTIPHNLGFIPAGVVVFDTQDTQIIGDVVSVTTTTIVLEFTSGFAGVAHVS